MFLRVKNLKAEGLNSVATGLLLTAGTLLAGCSKQSASETASFSRPVYSKQVREKSSITILTLSETNIASSGKIQLMLEVHAPENANITFPDIRYSIHPFSVADGYAEPKQILPNGQTLYRRAWTLLPGLPGSYELPALEIGAGDELLKTAPVQLTVTSILPEDIEGLEIRDIAPAAALLPEQEKKQRVAFFILFTTGLPALLFFIIRRLTRKKELIQPTAYDRAQESLSCLPEKPVERIHELNRILRSFIEAEFNLPMSGKTVVEIADQASCFAAPEQDMSSSTTEQVIAADRSTFTSTLIPFLEKGEQIRFSNKVPEGFTQEAEQFVRAFIEKNGAVLSCD